jgi:hypothetical protein
VRFFKRPSLYVIGEFAGLCVFAGAIIKFKDLNNEN